MALGSSVPDPNELYPAPRLDHCHRLPDGSRVVSTSVLGGLHHEYRLESARPEHDPDVSPRSSGGLGGALPSSSIHQSACLAWTMFAAPMPLGWHSAGGLRRQSALFSRCVTAWTEFLTTTGQMYEERLLPLRQ